MIVRFEFNPYPASYEETVRWRAALQKNLPQLADPADARFLLIKVTGVKPNQVAQVSASFATRAKGQLKQEAWSQDQLGDLPKRVVDALTAEGIAVTLAEP